MWRYRGWRWIIDVAVAPDDVANIASEAFNVELFQAAQGANPQAEYSGQNGAGWWTLSVMAGLDQSYIHASYVGRVDLSGSGWGEGAAVLGARLRGLGAKRVVFDDDDVEVA